MADGMEGRIYKATGGFYYVDTGMEKIECRARGIFRKEGQKPLVGDRVQISLIGDGSGMVDVILPRKNALVRPPLANLDIMVVVLSIIDPLPNLFVVDQYLAVLEEKEIEPLIVITKADLAPTEELAGLYRNAGFPVEVVDSLSRTGVETLMQRLAGKFSAFAGNSGAGKSSLINAIAPGLELAIGDTSRKLGRGRHTTRHVEIYTLPNGAMVADTPGFTSLELVQMSGITAETLADCFRDFTPYLGRCRFLDCSHTCEVGCAVRESVEQGRIARSRHESYCQLYTLVKEVKAWERR